ncbi:MAG TPA: hypothetical protein VHO24_10455 [Opitutaceae bacterium]|nr:hypothetical protein [Opitutaceae bacterium]
MSPPPSAFPAQLELPAKLAELIFMAALEMAKHSRRAFQTGRPLKRGDTLRPGKQTPLWNELRTQLRSHVVKHGDQANLGRLLGLPRQRVNAFLTEGSQMPDAERTLQLLAWLVAAKRNRPPA